MRNYKIDNRWNFREMAPSDAPAIYSARWIDRGIEFDVVPDRQGFAYDESADRDRLIAELELHDPKSLGTLNRNGGWVRAIETDTFTCVMRRFGGYVYVEAWTT